MNMFWRFVHNERLVLEVAMKDGAVPLTLYLLKNRGADGPSINLVRGAVYEIHGIKRQAGSMIVEYVALCGETAWRTEESYDYCQGHHGTVCPTCGLKR